MYKTLTPAVPKAVSPAVIGDVPNLVGQLGFLQGVLDRRITFTSASSRTYFDSTGTLQTAAPDVPRFDYNPTTLAPRGLLLEGARTNSIRNSTAQGASAPSTFPTNFTSVASIGLTREVVAVGTVNGFSYIDIRISGTPSSTAANQFSFETTTGIAAATAQTWTHSAYIALVGGSTSNVVGINLKIDENTAAGATVTGSSGSSILSSLTASLQRFEFTRAFSGGGTVACAFPIIRIDCTNGAAIDITLRFAGMQMEQGSFASSYIPTTSAAVARSADVCSITSLASIGYNQLEGTILAGYEVQALSATSQRVASFSDNTTNNRIALGYSGSATARTLVASGGVSQGDVTCGTSTALTVVKLAFAYKTDDLACVQNGGTVGTDSLATIPTVSRVYIGYNDTGTNFSLFGWMRSLTYYPTRLPNATLQALTT